MSELWEKGLNLPCSRIFLDYDDIGFRQVKKEVFRLQKEFNLSEADIFESSPSYLYDSSFFGYGIVRLGSWHVKFPKDVRKWEEVENILDFSNAHKGFRYFSKRMKDITLRISKKGNEGKVPEKVCTINEDGGVELYGRCKWS